jgi:phage major head subunit gpT-like protein
MAVKNTGLHLPGLRSEFLNRYNAAVEIARFHLLATRIESTKDQETYAFLGSVPVMREWGTGRLAKGMGSESYSVKNLKYEATIEVDRDEISDDQTGQIRLRINELAARAATHKDSLLADLIVNGDQTGFNSYDGVPFFSATHESGDSGAQDNTLAPTAVDADNPTTAEFQTAFKFAVARLLSFVDDTAQPMNLEPSGLVAVVPAGMYMTALQALNSSIVANNTNILQGAAKVLAFSRLTDASAWFLFKTDVVVRPFIFQDREPIEFKSMESDSESGFIREVYQYGVRARYRITYGYWQHALRSNFAAA